VVSNREVLLARAARYRRKAAELRALANEIATAMVRTEFLTMAADYDDMAAQLEAIADDYR
jgi:hypothetical protein